MQVCTSLQADNHASTPPLSFFTGRMPFLPPNQQRQSTEGSDAKQWGYNLGGLGCRKHISVPGFVPSSPSTDLLMCGMICKILFTINKNALASGGLRPPD